jgi:hypothetical protein
MTGPMTAWPARLRQRFSPGLKLRRVDGLATVVPGHVCDWAVGRSLCAYTLVDASQVPVPQRRAFVLAQAKRWAPFADPSFYVAWSGSAAMVWGWSTAEALAPALQGERRPRRVLPETVLRAEPRDGGAELVRVDEGFEGRAWSDGVLQASAWWAAEPSAAEWSAFLRGTGRPAQETVPVALEAPLRTAAWHARRDAGVALDLGRHRASIVLAIAALGVLAICVPLGSALRLWGEARRLEGAIARQEVLVAEIMAAREKAEGDAAAIQAHLALRPPVGQVRTLAAMLRALPAGWTLLEWRLLEGVRLEAVLRVDAPDPRAVVRGLEAARIFDAVSAEMGARPDEIVVRATLVPAQQDPRS